MNFSLRCKPILIIIRTVPPPTDEQAQFSRSSAYHVCCCYDTDFCLHGRPCVLVSGDEFNKLELQYICVICVTDLRTRHRFRANFDSVQGASKSKHYPESYSASEMTYIVSGGALNSTTHSLTPNRIKLTINANSIKIRQ